MDITNVSSALLAVNSADPGSLAGAVSLKMLDNAIDANESMSIGLTKMMEKVLLSLFVLMMKFTDLMKVQVQ